MWKQQTTQVFWNRQETCVTGWQEQEKSSETKLKSKLTTEIGLIKANPIKSLTNLKLSKESICEQHYCCDPQLRVYLMPVSWPPTFLHLIMLILVRRKSSDMQWYLKTAFARGYNLTNQEYTMGTSNCNSYFLGSILTTKYNFWFSKLVSWQKLLYQRIICKRNYKICLSNWKMPFFLQDASVIAIERCFLMQFSNIGIRQTYFILCVFLTSFDLL